MAGGGESATFGIPKFNFLSLGPKYNGPKKLTNVRQFEFDDLIADEKSSPMIHFVYVNLTLNDMWDDLITRRSDLITRRSETDS